MIWYSGSWRVWNHGLWQAWIYIDLKVDGDSGVHVGDIDTQSCILYLDTSLKLVLNEKDEDIDTQRSCVWHRAAVEDFIAIGANVDMNIDTRDMLI